MKFLFLFFFIINFFIPGSYAEDQPKEQKILVGVLTEQYTRVCTGKEDQWIDPHFEVGFTRVVPPEKSKIKWNDYVGQIVTITGEIDSHYQTTTPQHTGSCLEYQMRSDWVTSKNGIRKIRFTPALVTGIDAFHIKEIKKFEGLHVELTPEEVEVTFENSFLEDLKNVKMIAHYEGCYGKPGAMESFRLFKRLRKNESVFARFPKILKKEGAQVWQQNHAINSIQIYSSNHDILFDLDWPLKEGAEILKECESNRGISRQ